MPASGRARCAGRNRRSAIAPLAAEFSPTTPFNFELAILFLLAVTLGGRKNRLGAIIGAAIVVLLPNLLSDVKLFRLLTAAIAVALALGAAYALVRTRRSQSTCGAAMLQRRSAQ